MSACDSGPEIEYRIVNSHGVNKNHFLAPARPDHLPAVLLLNDAEYENAAIDTLNLPSTKIVFVNLRLLRVRQEAFIYHSW